MNALSQSRLSRLNRTMLGLAVLVLTGMVGMSYHQWSRYNRANAIAARTQDIVVSVDALLANLADAESGQRGFLLTSEERYLEPYNRALPLIRQNLSRISSLLADRPGEAANIARLGALVDEQLNGLEQAIELRRTQGAKNASALLLNNQGNRAMDDLRALGSEIERQESSAQHQASSNAEDASETALLTTLAGSLVLIFLFAFRLEPFVTPDSRPRKGQWALRYGAAILAVVAAFLLRLALTPLIGPTTLVFTLFFPAVLFVAWFAGFRAGVLCLALAALAANFYFAEPTGSLRLVNRQDQVELLIFVLVGLGMALLAHSQREAVERAVQAEGAERRERQRFETTLASIGDAVVATDAEGRITFVNKVAQSLLRASKDALLGQPLDNVFQIVNESTRAKVESPIAKVLQEGGVAGLANHTVLIAQDGTEIPIDDSGAAIRSEGGAIQGAVLVFRDITERRRAEEARRESEVNARLLHIQDEERRRIGRELHDGAGQNLVVLKIHLDLLASDPAADEATRQKLTDCIYLANELIREIRTTSYALYPPLLEHGGLKSAIPSFLDGFMQRSGIAVNLVISPDFTRAPREVELAIFRVLQESLTNVLRHSGSPVAEIRLGMTDGTLRLEVMDQGKGIPPEVLEAFNHGSLGKLGVGLRGMKERLRQLGGHLHVSSTPGGTTVTAAIAPGKHS